MSVDSFEGTRGDLPLDNDTQSLSPLERDRNRRRISEEAIRPRLLEAMREGETQCDIVEDLPPIVDVYVDPNLFD